MPPMPLARPRRTFAALGVVALLGLSACATGFEGPGEFFDVSGGQVHLWCDGDSNADRGPTVMFISAIGGDDTMVPIGERITDQAMACFYYRPGDGDTEPPDGPRTAADDAADLHELLAAAEIDTPVVLVAHSYGGLITLVAAAEHPEEIAGVVFVDASQPDAEAEMYTVMTDDQRAYFDAERENFPYIDWPTSLNQARVAMAAFPDVPLTVITATRAFLEPCDPMLPCEDLQATWIDAQETYGDLAPGARHVLADTGHYVHEDDPDLVEAEIRALLERLSAP